MKLAVLTGDDAALHVGVEMGDDDRNALENGARLVEHHTGEIGAGGAALRESSMARGDRGHGEDEYEPETDASHLIPFTGLAVNGQRYIPLSGT
jgi:hypothetical protein